MTYDALPVVVPAALVALTLTVFVPVAVADDVAVSVTVVDAPDASVTLELDTLPVQPAGTDDATDSVSAAQPVFLFVIVAVYESADPAAPVWVDGDSETVGFAVVHDTT